MSALDEIVNLSQGITAYTARAELSALRTRVEQAASERDEARARVAELEAATDNAAEQIENGDIRIAHDVLHSANVGSTLTPRRCGTCCAEAAKAMREAAAEFADDFDVDSTEFDLPTSIGAGIRALPLPSCDGCNPLKTEDAS